MRSGRRNEGEDWGARNMRRTREREGGDLQSTILANKMERLHRLARHIQVEKKRLATAQKQLEADRQAYESAVGRHELSLEDVWLQPPLKYVQRLSHNGDVCSRCKAAATEDRRNVAVCVAGTTFLTTAETLGREPDSLLAELIQRQPKLSRRRKQIMTRQQEQWEKWSERQSWLMDQQEAAEEKMEELLSRGGSEDNFRQEIHSLQKKVLLLENAIEEGTRIQRDQEVSSRSDFGGDDVYIQRDWWIFRYVLQFLRDGILPPPDQQINGGQKRPK